MTIEEKAKAYDDMLFKTRCLYNSMKKYGVEASCSDILLICPELSESDNDRIRKTLIEELSACNTVGELKFRLPQPTRDECIAWLEKHEEYKWYSNVLPDDSLTDELMLKKLISLINWSGTPWPSSDKDKIIAWLEKAERR